MALWWQGGQRHASRYMSCSEPTKNRGGMTGISGSPPPITVAVFHASFSCFFVSKTLARKDMDWHQKGYCKRWTTLYAPQHTYMNLNFYLYLQF